MLEEFPFENYNDAAIPRFSGCPTTHLLSCYDRFMDFQVLERMLSSTYQDSAATGSKDEGAIVRRLKNGPYTFGNHFLNLAALHYFENDAAIRRLWTSRVGLPRLPEGPLPTAQTSRKVEQGMFRLSIRSVRLGKGSTWYLAHVLHLSRLRQKVNTQGQLPLYDGGACLPTVRQTADLNGLGIHGCRVGLDLSYDLVDSHTPPVSYLPVWVQINSIQQRWSVPSWPDFDEHHLQLPRRLLGRQQHPVELSPRVGRGRTGEGIWATGRRASGLPGKDDPTHDPGSRRSRTRRTCTSEPPFGSFTSAFMDLSRNLLRRRGMQIMYPRMPLSQLESRSRRRSLSRTRIEEMFDWDTDFQPAFTNATPYDKRFKCENCTSQQHITSICPSPCGHCGARTPNAFFSRSPKKGHDRALGPPHLAPQCPVTRQNRCKCVPFPTFHTAQQCAIPCRRACGNTTSPGSFAHRNAMTCRVRCCMCGLRGHSGRECRLRKCRCGEAHLGQDCGWKPECRVRGCDRFLCGVHCRECGSTEKPFVGWRCARCLGFEKPLDERREEGQGRRAMRRRKGQNGGGEAGGDGLAGEVEPEPTAVTGSSVEPPAPVALLVSKETEPEILTPGGHRSIFGDPRARHTTRTGR